MRKENVFLVSSRRRGPDGQPSGAIVSQLICGVSEESMLKFAAKVLPGSEIVAAVNYSALVDTVMKMKNVLAGADTSWAVFVEPGL